MRVTTINYHQYAICYFYYRLYEFSGSKRCVKEGCAYIITTSDLETTMCETIDFRLPLKQPCLTVSQVALTSHLNIPRI